MNERIIKKLEKKDSDPNHNKVELDQPVRHDHLIIRECVKQMKNLDFQRWINNKKNLNF